MEDLLQFLYLMPVGAIKFHADGAVELMNPVAAALLLSVSPDSSLDNLYTALATVAPDLQGRLADFPDEAGAIIDQHWLGARAGQAELILSLTVNLIKADVYVAVLTDVTRLAQQERKLFADRQKFFAIFDHVRDYAIYTITLDGTVEEWNQSVQRYGGWLADDIEGRNIGMFFPQDDPQRPQIETLLAEARRIGSTETEGWRLKRDGSRLWANSVVTSLPDESGTVRGFVVVSRDITERKRLADDMEKLATVDALTGAYNRRQGDGLIAVEFGRRARTGRPLAVLMLDIDFFKQINDRFGHAAGDAALRALARVCVATLRPVDVLIRWGGDEFVVLLPETDGPAGLAAGERLRRAIEVSGTEDPAANPGFTISVGVAVPASDSPSELLSRADSALYAAKKAGRNRVVLAP